MYSLGGLLASLLDALYYLVRTSAKAIFFLIFSAGILFLLEKCWVSILGNLPLGINIVHVVLVALLLALVTLTNNLKSWVSS